MNRQLFPQNVIAMIWDFDKTLIPGNMQGPLFRHFGIDEAAFWDEVDGLEEWYRSHGAGLVARDRLYLDHILTYVREGRMQGLSNHLLRQLGAEVPFYEGIPDFLELVKKSIESEPRFSDHQIRVEHYVVSTGLRQMILGSAVAPFVDDVWACEFTELVAPPGYRDHQGQLFSPDGEIRQLIYTIDNTTKTRALFEINKGTNKNPGIDVNAKMAREDRRVPFQNMIYIADGPSDVPVFSVVEANGGRTYAVYRPGSQGEFEQAARLLEQDRVDAFGEADYSESSHTAMWLTHAVDGIARRIVSDREEALSERVGLPPTHVGED
ncbi:MAG TPA: haloacid dehalogenase-like hydrolase [Acidimicrobiia bacterium]|nr:haloacid dehalogenase-like hydrolase [Acidimicrobiia bacterium]